MPRKSTASTAEAPAETNGDTSVISNAAEPKPTSKPSRQSTGKHDDSTGIDDLLLPRSLTSRLARGVLPANTSIQKDAILALTKSATVFISYLASHANELTTKKTIAPQDVLNALKEIEMGSIMSLGEVGEDGRIGGRLERELEVFEDVVRGKRKGYREKVKARESGVSTTQTGEGAGDDEERGEPDSKKARRMSDDDELLDAQLNGTGESVNNAGEELKTPEGDGMEDEHDEHDEHDDETESDPEADEEDEDEDDEDDNADPEDRIEDDDDEGQTQQSRLNLVPNGRDEVGSEDESD